MKQEKKKQRLSLGSLKEKYPKIIRYIPILLVIVLVAVIGYLFNEYKQLNNKLSDPEYLAQQQLEYIEETRERVISKVESIYMTPEDNPKEVLTVSDAEALKKENPEFYKNAQTGDYLLLYEKEAIIFRDGENKIINIAPVQYEDVDKDNLDDTK